MSNTSNKELIDAAEALDALIAQHKQGQLYRMFPATGEYSQETMPKHMEFFKAGATYKERCFIGGNRVGKSVLGATEVVYHATGLYPDWWKGIKFEIPTLIICSGKTNLTTRNIIQEKLIGKSLLEEDFGTGLIPKDLILRKTMRPGLPDAIQDIYVKHVSGGTCRILLNSYEQGRSIFEGMEAHVVWFDEEPPLDCYLEAKIRTMTTQGTVFTTFTPKVGLSDVVLAFLPGGVMPDTNAVSESKWVTKVSWDDISHLTEQDQKQQLDGVPAHLAAAIRDGTPCVGEGKIYPIDEKDLLIDHMVIPTHWPRAYGMDTGWNRTAAIWIAKDPNTDTLYIYDEYYRGQAEPSGHVAAIKGRGDWMNGTIDWAGSTNGERIMHQYQELGLKVYPADKRAGSVDAGILYLYRLMCDGKLKVLPNCVNWLKEFRIYRYDKAGKPVKQHDHLMDATRYGIMGFEGVCATQLDADDDLFYKPNKESGRNVSEITGY